ncbi:hypothetical protein ACRAVF_34030 (plasmid) [Bradyrhizobium oligotrophicum S58]
MDESPLDQLNVQLPGRMLTMEILLTLLLRKQSKAGQILKAADERLSVLEAVLIKDGHVTDYQLNVFAAARASLDHFVRNVGPRHG